MLFTSSNWCTLAILISISEQLHLSILKKHLRQPTRDLISSYTNQNSKPVYIKIDHLRHYEICPLIPNCQTSCQDHLTVLSINGIFQSQTNSIARVIEEINWILKACRLCCFRQTAALINGLHSISFPSNVFSDANIGPRICFWVNWNICIFRVEFQPNHFCFALDKLGI